MIKISLLFLGGTVGAFAANATANFFLLGFIIFIIGLFFWGVYKAIKTQKNSYMFAMLPFILFLVWVFSI